jgi:hypothetical protein
MKNIKQLKPSKSSRYQQGYINADSCKKLFPQLKHDKIIYRSSYERKFMIWLETSKDVKYWGSECFSIPYYYVVDEKMHSYYPDYFVEMMDGSCIVVEIKPSNQTVKPINENCWAYKEYTKNMCKWKATKEFCDAKGYKFKIFTEKTIQKL